MSYLGVHRIASLKVLAVGRAEGLFRLAIIPADQVEHLPLNRNLIWGKCPAYEVGRADGGLCPPRSRLGKHANLFDDFIFDFGHNLVRLTEFLLNTATARLLAAL